MSLLLVRFAGAFCFGITLYGVMPRGSVRHEFNVVRTSETCLHPVSQTTPLPREQQDCAHLPSIMPCRRRMRVFVRSLACMSPTLTGDSEEQKRGPKCHTHPRAGRQQTPNRTSPEQLVASPDLASSDQYGTHRASTRPASTRPASTPRASKPPASEPPPATATTWHTTWREPPAT